MSIISLTGMFVNRFSTSKRAIYMLSLAVSRRTSLAIPYLYFIMKSFTVSGERIETRYLASLKAGVLQADKTDRT